MLQNSFQSVLLISEHWLAGCVFRRTDISNSSKFRSWPLLDEVKFSSFFLLLLSTSLVDKVLSSVNIFNSNEDCYYSG